MLSLFHGPSFERTPCIDRTGMQLNKIALKDYVIGLHPIAPGNGTFSQRKVPYEKANEESRKEVKH